MLRVAEEGPRPKKRKRGSVSFNDEEEVINPEDVDPTVGRFRNLVQTAIIPHSKKGDEPLSMGQGPKVKRRASEGPEPPPWSRLAGLTSSSLVPNPAPDVDLAQPSAVASVVSLAEDLRNEPKKKKYAKEAWPGKKNASLLG